MKDSLEKKIQDLEFLLRREKIENKTKIKDILYQMLDIKDSLDRLIQIASRQSFPSEVHKFISERFSLISQKLVQELERAGGVQINSLGEQYNEEYHEVIGFVKNPDVPENQIVKVEQEGYLLEGIVLRMAKVFVARSQQS